MQFDANVKGTHWHICGKSQCSGGDVVYTVLRPVWFLAQFKWISILPKRKKTIHSSRVITQVELFISKGIEKE